MKDGRNEKLDFFNAFNDFMGNAKAKPILNDGLHCILKADFSPKENLVIHFSSEMLDSPFMSLFRTAEEDLLRAPSMSSA
jgi:hypothetical protein